MSTPTPNVPDQADVDQLRGLLDLMANYPNNDQRARYLLTCNWMRDRDAKVEQLNKELDEAKAKLADQAEDVELLAALQSAGVDNWSGYDYAHEILREWHGGESE